MSMKLPETNQDLQGRSYSCFHEQTIKVYSCFVLNAKYVLHDIGTRCSSKLSYVIPYFQPILFHIFQGFRVTENAKDIVPFNSKGN
jgi:hypothetical protein